MSVNNDTDLLRFPSGLSVRQAKANAKKRKVEEGIPLHEAQKQIARENGLNMNWDCAITQIKNGGEKERRSQELNHKDGTHKTGEKNKIETHCNIKPEPLFLGTKEESIDQLSSLLVRGGEEHGYYAKRAVATINLLIPALIELRDSCGLTITASLVVESFKLSKFMEFTKNHIVIDGVHRQELSLSRPTITAIGDLLDKLPGFDSNLDAECQSRPVKEFFMFAEGYIVMALSRLTEGEQNNQG